MAHRPGRGEHRLAVLWIGGALRQSQSWRLAAIERHAHPLLSADEADVAEHRLHFGTVYRQHLEPDGGISEQ